MKPTPIVLKCVNGQWQVVQGVRRLETLVKLSKELK